jgi:hypothetical protein
MVYISCKGKVSYLVPFLGEPQKVFSFLEENVILGGKFFEGEAHTYLGETLFTTYPLLVRGL